MLQTNNPETLDNGQANVEGQVASLLSVYTKTAGTTSTVGLRANAADAGSPAQLSVATTGTGAWTTDNANSFVVQSSDELDWETPGAAAATITCVAVTMSTPNAEPIEMVAQATLRAVPRASLF